MTRSQLSIISGAALLAAVSALTGCAVPESHSVTSEVITTPVPAVPVVTQQTTTTEEVQPARIVHRRGDLVEEESDESGSTTTYTAPAAPLPVQSTTTRSTTETIGPH